MASNLNVVALTGRLTADPERRMAGGTALCSFRLAFNGTRKDASGAYVDDPGYVNVSVFGPQAEACATHLHKGRQVAVNGRLKWREWQSDAGKRSALDVVAQSVEFLSAPQGHAQASATEAAAPEGEDF